MVKLFIEKLGVLKLRFFFSIELKIEKKFSNPLAPFLTFDRSENIKKKGEFIFLVIDGDKNYKPSFGRIRHKVRETSKSLSFDSNS